MKDLERMIRDVPDFPKKGIVFKDITTLLKDAKALKKAIDRLAGHYRGRKIDKVVSMESRGFIFGTVLAYKLGCGFVPIRKKNKLPWKTYSVTYALEYGKDTLEIHRDGVRRGEKVLIVDDLLATGGTAKAVVDLIKRLKAKVAGCAFLIELSFLPGRKKLRGCDIFSLIKY